MCVCARACDESSKTRAQTFAPVKMVKRSETGSLCRMSNIDHKDDKKKDAYIARHEQDLKTHDSTEQVI